MPDNTICMNKDKPFVDHQHASVVRVRLRGAWAEGNHQEVMLDLNNGELVRISRTNGSDTFQIGAAEEGRSKFPMKTLIEVQLNGRITCRDAFSAFGDVHRAVPRYDQADCQVFAKRYMLAVAPEAESKFVSNELEDSFM